MINFQAKHVSNIISSGTGHIRQNIRQFTKHWSPNSLGALCSQLRTPNGERISSMSVFPNGQMTDSKQTTQRLYGLKSLFLLKTFPLKCIVFTALSINLMDNAGVQAPVQMALLFCEHFKL